MRWPVTAISGRAAEACSISQPALSMQIREMERGRRRRPDRAQRAAGDVERSSARNCLHRVRDILRSVDELGDFARASRDKLAGRLRVGMIPTIAPYLLPKVIETLARLHPELDIHVRETLTPKLIKEVAEGRLDTAIVALPVSEPSLTEVALFSEIFLLVRPGEAAGNAGAERRDAARDAALAARGGPLLPRPGAVVLQHAVLAAARGAGRQLAIDPGADGRRRHRRHSDPGDGGQRSKPARPRSRSRASSTRSRRAPSAWSGARPARWRHNCSRSPRWSHWPRTNCGRRRGGAKDAAKRTGRRKVA